MSNQVNEKKSQWISVQSKMDVTKAAVVGR